MPDFTTPDFLAIGHLTYDVTPEPGDPHGRVRPGGAAAFAAVTARALGLKVAVVTSVAPSYPVGDILPDIATQIIEAPFTTFFQNVYRRAAPGRFAPGRSAQGEERGERWQVLGGRAASIARADIPPEWIKAPIVFLGPLVREVPPDAVTWFPDAAVGGAVQGWLRRWDDYGRITEEAEPPGGLASGYRLLAGSTREFPGREGDEGHEMARWAKYADVVGMTDGPAGSRIRAAGRETSIPAYRAEEIDPTGAGDVWAAACLVRLVETGDPVEAARFANAAGSVSVERRGLSAAPHRAEIESRMARR